MVRKEITKYPNRNCLDVLKFGQEDDSSVPDPDGCNWDIDENASELATDDVMGETIPDFSADDWVEGQSAALTYGVAADEDAQNHGDGAQNHCDGGLALAVLETMDEEDVDTLVERSTKLRTLREASKLFKDMGGVLGDSLRNTVSSVIQIDQTPRSKPEGGHDCCQGAHARFSSGRSYVSHQKDTASRADDA